MLNMNTYLESYMIKARSKYLDPLSKGKYCIGNKSECYDFIEDGHVRIAWGKSPDREEYEKIKQVLLLPTDSQLKKMQFPDFLNDLTELEYLSIPFPLVTVLNKEIIPQNVNFLMLANNYKYSSFFDDTKVRTSDPVFLTLKGLGFIGDYDNSGRCSLLNFDVTILRNLEFLRCYLDRKGTVLGEIKKMKNLIFLELTYVYGFDIFSSIGSNLRILSITSANRQFKLENINKLPRLEILQLNGVKGEIDCSVFNDLPELKEILIYNSKYITNITKLLECKNLKSLEIINCKNPFNKEEKALFQNHGFERIDIDYS